MTTHAMLNLPNAQTGDVSAGDVAGRDQTTVHQGLDGDHVVDLIGGRFERWLELIVRLLMALIAAVAFQTAILLLLAAVIALVLNPHLIAGM